MTKETINQIIDQNIIDNDSGAITAEVLRKTLKSMLELSSSAPSQQQYTAWVGSFPSIDENTFALERMQIHNGAEDEAFDFEIIEDGDHLVIALQSDIAVGSITSNGIEIPMQPPFIYDNKQVFVSSHKLKQGLINNILIIIN